MPAVMCEIQAPLTRRGFLYLGHPGTGLERPAYSQAPRRGGETGVFVPNKSYLSRKRLFHGLDLTTPGITGRGLGRPKMSKLQSCCWTNLEFVFPRGPVLT